MNFKSLTIMMLLGATEAIQITRLPSGPAVAGDASTVVEGATEGIAEAKAFVNIGVRFTNSPVIVGEAPLSETATAGITDGRANQGFVQLGDEPNKRNAHRRSMSQKYMGVRTAADPISPEDMDDWVYEYSKDNTNWATQWHDIKHAPSEYA